MILCPDCQGPLSDMKTACASCGWQVETVADIPVMLSSEDRQNPIFKRYLENYDRIAEEDLADDILDPVYVMHQVDNMVDYIGALDGDVVCDVGSGQGHLARKLLEKGARSVTLVDIALPYLRAGAEGEARLSPVMANAENLPFEDRFDIMTSTDVMEHVLNLGSFLFSVNRALKMGGRAFIRVPFRESLLSYTPHLGCPYPFVHLRSFNKDILSIYMRSAGFEVERFHYDGFILGRPQPFWMANQWRMDRYMQIQEWAKARISNPADVTRWPSWFARMLMPPCEIVVVARKQASLNEGTPA